MQTLIWISMPHATFGLVAANGVIVKTAPISKLSLGRTVDDVIRYYQNRGAKVLVKTPG